MIITDDLNGRGLKACDKCLQDNPTDPGKVTQSVDLLQFWSLDLCEKHYDRLIISSAISLAVVLVYMKSSQPDITEDDEATKKDFVTRTAKMLF